MNSKTLQTSWSFSPATNRCNSGNKWEGEFKSHTMEDVKPEVRFPDFLTLLWLPHFTCFSDEQSCRIDVCDKWNMCIAGLRLLGGAVKSLVFIAVPLKLWQVCGPLASYCGSLGSSHARLLSFHLIPLERRRAGFEDHTGAVLQRASGSSSCRVWESI